MVGRNITFSKHRLNFHGSFLFSFSLGASTNKSETWRGRWKTSRERSERLVFRRPRQVSDFFARSPQGKRKKREKIRRNKPQNSGCQATKNDLWINTVRIKVVLDPYLYWLWRYNRLNIGEIIKKFSNNALEARKTQNTANRKQK